VAESYWDTYCGSEQVPLCRRRRRRWSSSEIEQNMSNKPIHQREYADGSAEDYWIQASSAPGRRY
jgi:hypothetical protein